MSNAIILIHCPDQRGITATVTDFIFKHNGNIIDADQHRDEQSNTFFMRVEWSLEGFDLKKDKIQEAFAPLAKKFKMHYELHFTDDEIRMAIFVSKQVHCLYDLLYRCHCGQLKCTVPLIVSNHEDAKGLADNFGIKYLHAHVSPENKVEQEKKQLKALKEKKIELVVLARYHQILTKSFVNDYPNRIINIHHSFLPAFAGKNPYGQAFERGVKIIGATSHFVTEELDEGPIIHQDTVEISHRDNLGDLMDKGEDLEKIVLGRAVKLYCERKILACNNKTVVFP